MIAQRLLHQAQGFAEIGEQAAMGPGHFKAPSGGKLGFRLAGFRATAPALEAGAATDGGLANAETGSDLRQEQLAEAIFPFDAPPVGTGLIGGLVRGHRRAISGTNRLCTHYVLNQTVHRRDDPLGKFHRNEMARPRHPFHHGRGQALLHRGGTAPAQG
jgi:hypothetical protein